jgi:hypothetical protein
MTKMTKTLIVLGLFLQICGCDNRSNRIDTSKRMRSERIARQFSIEINRITSKHPSGMENWTSLDELNSIKRLPVDQVLLDPLSIGLGVGGALGIDFDKGDYMYIVIKISDIEKEVWRIRPDILQMTTK